MQRINELREELSKLEKEESSYSITRYGKSYNGLSIKRDDPVQKFESFVIPILNETFDFKKLPNIEELIFIIEELKDIGVVFTCDFLNNLIGLIPLHVRIQLLNPLVKMLKNMNVSSDVLRIMKRSFISNGELLNLYGFGWNELLSVLNNLHSQRILASI